MSSRFCLWVLLGSCVCLATSVAQAQSPKIVVMDFAGSGGDAARAQVLRGLRDEASFVPRSEAKKVLASEGAKVSSVAGRAAVANELGLDYLIWGRVRGRGSSARAEIRIAGPQGKQITEREAGPAGQSNGNSKIRKAARAALAKAMQVAPPKRGPAKVEPIEVTEIQINLAEEARPPKKAEAAEKREPKEKSKPKEKPKPRMNPSPKAPILNILGGAGGRARKVKIGIDDGAGGSATRTYESGVYLDIVFRLELRPWARNERKGLRGLALEADGDFGVGLDTQTPGVTAKLATKSWRVLGQLGYFHGFGKSEIGGLVGIGFDALDIEDNGTMPSIEYLFFRIGPAFRYFFIERTLYLRIDAGFRLPFSYGELADTFGDAESGLGFDAGLMLGGELEVGFSYVLRVSTDFFKPKFGAFPGGTLPGLPGAAQGRDGTDLAINFNLMIGWSF